MTTVEILNIEEGFLFLKSQPKHRYVAFCGIGKL
jgi:hypothetical protein